ncbi:DUF6296 family protein [Streptomyces sp. CBMA123]|uniref:DUF6296 family protein n=1 Tax=Streptomyces sp. CBMA123 TaxID=1896313 RepID=UPI00166201B3|nr:DUF6296 family protein [Streptomyces sp. CBMA123]
MEVPLRYAVTLPGPTGSHAPPRVVVVQATGEVSPDGEPVYTDAAGTLRVEVAHGVARPLDPAPGRHACLRALPMP